LVCECLRRGGACVPRLRARAAAVDPQDRGGRRHGPDPRRPGQRQARRVARIADMKDLLVPVSPGELLDKITILRIKVARMQDAAKLANVKLELALLETTWRDSGCAANTAAGEEHALQQVNERLWDIEDRIRDKEARQTFDRDFIELARSVYVSNDERA